MSRVLAVVVLILAGSLTTASPALAAGAQHIQNVPTGACVDQHFNAAGAATITVYAWSSCHNEGNQNWAWEGVGNGWYRVVNNRWDPATGLRWCLSAPEGAADPNRVYAEYCRADLPAKQKWKPLVVTPPGAAQRIVIENARRPDVLCMGQHAIETTKVYVAPCVPHGNTARFRWTRW
ncbi:RICIN domain-containing protein [Actinoplanes sp. M2I2]|uniref:RICIN domain-containing protein n=1 Tax=Actinoplanes sp. M2I2 TaxID=1734444 RepID=UPI0020212219|nr:RICIN domain-containing protein [Actinoplanes sp. M2I2]